ncbi:hypothetical protein [uncultured Arcticibacterium sp.]|uniref:hypothetical protein n=1 Tax=uncultured Arcticibacterium sp. TaxID=2173042 RepID=UPI0030F8E0B4
MNNLSVQIQGVSSKVFEDICSVLPPQLQSQVEEGKNQRNAIDSVAIVSFLVGSVGGGIAYDLFRFSVTRVYKFLSQNLETQRAILEVVDNKSDTMIEASREKISIIKEDGQEINYTSIEEAVKDLFGK